MKLTRDNTCVLMMISSTEYPAIIERALRSTMPYASQVIITTNGPDRFDGFTTNGGTVIWIDNGPWIGFGPNRTKAMQDAIAITDKDWIVTLDADDQLMPCHDHDTDIAPGVYNMLSIYGNLKYHTPMLFNVALLRGQSGWNWYGYMHESWSSPWYTENADLPMYQLRGWDSERSVTGRCDLAELEILRQGYLAGVTRDRFYYGRQCQDMGKYNESIEPLTMHALDATVWVEERYVACIGVYHATGDAVWLDRAGQLLPGRAEWLYYKIKQWQTNISTDKGLFVDQKIVDKLMQV